MAEQPELPPMPCMLYGTAWKKEKTTELVVRAVAEGFRAIDTACQPKHYNEPQVGAALAELASSHGIKRSEVFIQTKYTPLDSQDRTKPLPYDASAPLDEQVRQSFATSLRNLGTHYVDSLLLHTTFEEHERTMVVWAQFEALVDAGLVRFVGLSNVRSLAALERVWTEARVKPAVVQNRFYADTGYDVAIRRFCLEHEICYQSFWTLTANPAALESAAVMSPARRLAWTPAQVVYRYLIEMGCAPLTGTTSVEHMRDDLAVLAAREGLSDAELRAIARLFGDL